MRVLALALFVVAAATCCLAKGLDVVALERLAESEGAPFTRASREMMEESGLWAANRANRTSDVVIINASNKPFQLTNQWCAQGKIAQGLKPADKLNAMSSIVTGADNTIYLRGVQCTLVYESPLSERTWVTLMTHVPFDADNVAYPFSSGDLKISASVGRGINNQVIFTIKNSYGGSSLQSSQNGGLSHKKPKGNRNKFYRTSKSGSRSGKY